MGAAADLNAAQAAKVVGRQLVLVALAKPPASAILTSAKLLAEPPAQTQWQQRHGAVSKGSHDVCSTSARRLDAVRTAQRNIGASIFTALIGIGAVLIATPMIIDHVGKAAYGVWTVSMAIVIYVGIVEAGMAPAIQRHVAAARAEGDARGAARVFWTALLFYLALGLLAAALIELLAPQIAGLFNFPAALELQATELLRIVGLAVPLGLAMAAVANLLQGQGRFSTIAVTAALGSVGYLTAIVLLVGANVSLSQLGWAVIAQQLVLLLTRAALVVGSLRVRPGLVSGEEVVAMGGLSARLQLSVASLIINGQSDRVVAGLVAPPAVVGEVGIASQLAESGRLVAAAPLVPIFNRFAELQQPQSQAGLARLFELLDRLWLKAALGGSLIGVAVAPSLIRGWLGAGFALAGGFAALLVAAYGSNLLFGVRTVYLRASGRAGLEARLALVLIALNLLLTVPLAIAFGATGVVLGTLVAYLIAGGWFALRFTAYAPEAPSAALGPLLGAGGWAVLFALAAGAAAAGAAVLLPTGWALLPIALIGAGAWGGYLCCSLRIAPTPSALRRWRTELEAQLAGTRPSTIQSP